ncbi:MAG: hypothetical protein HYX69_11110 [Planctomycetia bacterium]|nr:hypothetical protein [Planctomycetia bacterium]
MLVVRLRAAKRRIERRLDKSKVADCSRPVFATGNIHYEMAERTRGMTYGGLGAIVLFGAAVGRGDRSAVAAVEDSPAVSRKF